MERYNIRPYENLVGTMVLCTLELVTAEKRSGVTNYTVVVVLRRHLQLS